MSIQNMEMRSVRAGDVTLNVRDQGSGEPTLVFLHYWGGSARTWAQVIDRLAGRHRCVAFDQRGWGGSEAPADGYATHDLANDVLALIEALELTNYVLVGHSMGGKVAQVVAGDRPQGLRGLILIGPAPAALPGPIPDQVRDQLLNAYKTREGVLQTLDMALSYQSLTPEVREQVVEDSMAGSPQAITAWPTKVMGEDVSASLARIDVPVLVIGADQDKIEPVGLLTEHVVAAIDGATLEVVTDSGHLMPLEQPQQVTELIAAFVARLGA